MNDISFVMTSTSVGKTLAPTIARRVIDAAGGCCNVARLCNISSSAVAQWLTNGIPMHRALFLRELFPEISEIIEGN